MATTADHESASELTAADRLLEQGKRLRFTARAISLVVAAAGGTFLGVLLYILIAIVHDYFLERVARARGESPFNLMGDYFGLYMALIIYGGLFLLPFLLTLPVTGPLVALWRRPVRLLYLRPFHRGKMTRPLLRSVRRDIADLGHVYTLSDADISVPWYVRIPVLFGQLSLLSFRMRPLRQPAHLMRLRRALARTWMRNINWCLSWRKVFPVACSDAVWRDAVALLIEEVDVVLVDLTEVTSNVEWEIHLCRRLGREARVLYLVSAERRDQSLAQLSFDVRETSAELPVLTYGSEGITDRAAFRQLVARTAGAAQISRGEFDPASVIPLLDKLALLAFALGLWPLLNLALPIFSETGLSFLPVWKQWDWSTPWPGVSAVVTPGVVVVLSCALLALLRLAWTGRRDAGFRLLAVIQAVVLVVTPLGVFDY